MLESTDVVHGRSRADTEQQNGPRKISDGTETAVLQLSTRAVSGMHRQCLKCASSNEHSSSSLCDVARENVARSSSPSDHHTDICVGPTNSTTWSRPYQIKHRYQPAHVPPLSTNTGHALKQAYDFGHRRSRTDGNRKRGGRDTSHHTPPPSRGKQVCAQTTSAKYGGEFDSCENDARRAIPLVRPRACVSCFTGSEWSSQRRVTCHIGRAVGTRLARHVRCISAFLGRSLASWTTVLL